MVGIDANVLSLFLFPSASAPNDFRTKKPIDRAHERAEFLIADLQERGETVLIPTPALSEVLVVVPDINRCMEILQAKGCFKIGNFGERAAIEVALRIRLALKAGDKSEAVASPWQKVKYDRQIVAISKVEGCAVLYSTDEDIHKHGSLWKLPVLNISDVKLGGQTILPFEPNEETKEKNEEQTQPTPPEVSGSPPGPPPSEAGAETAEAKEEGEGKTEQS